jgi:hypothetical protein
VLSEAGVYLWEGIRADAIAYFGRNNISWWKGEGAGPTGHMLSSQVACLNHLYFLRQRRDLADAILSALDPDVTQAEVVDDGYVEFEFIGAHQYLKEKAFSRGANCTSVDAFMIGTLAGGDKRAFLIEWKYTEKYAREDKYIPERAKVYDHLITSKESPFKEVEARAFYFEPFYQMMRQTLLGSLIGRHEDHGCTSYRHIHVIPEQNTDLNNYVTSRFLKDTTVAMAWQDVLRCPEFYISTTPASFMKPLITQRDTKALTDYLQWRYWSGV